MAEAEAKDCGMLRTSEVVFLRLLSCSFVESDALTVFDEGFDLTNARFEWVYFGVVFLFLPFRYPVGLLNLMH